MEVSEISHRIIADLLAARTGQHLTEDRRWRIESALSGIFRERGISNVDQLVCLLAEPSGKGLAQQVVEALLNNETYFFRDRSMFDMIDRHALTQLERKRADTKRLSIWSAGCSTGQEPLSLAMMFAAQPARWAGWKIEINGTDVSANAIAAAKAGTYTQFEIQRGLGVTQMISHFTETPGGWQANRELREMVRYRVGNILEPADQLPRHDLVLCRNVLLYFDSATRDRAFQRLSETIAPDGYLMLGAGETAVGRTTAFQPSADMQGLYSRTFPKVIETPARGDSATLAKRGAGHEFQRVSAR